MSENCPHHVNADRVERPDTKNGKFSESDRMAGGVMLENATNRDLLTAWRDGNSSAATILVRRDMARLLALASSRLSKKLARRVDAEDVVLSAWRSFFVATDRNCVDVPDDDNLWPLLVTMTLRKLARQVAKHSAEHRAVQREVEHPGESDWPAIVAEDPTPAEAAAVTDEIEFLMQSLDASEREVLTLRLQGAQHRSIAKSVGCSERTVRRSLQRIRARYLAVNHDQAAAPVVMNAGRQVVDRPFSERFASDDEKSETSSSTKDVASCISHVPTAQIEDVLLHEMIGLGAFGKVYRATWRTTGATVAVKYLRKSFWRNADATEQLIHEVSVVSTLSHSGIVHHHGWGRTEQGAVFAIMEWVEGSDLYSWRETCELSVAKVLRCGIEICDALSAAHQAGIVHGDLTPGNVLCRQDGSFVLTDFGFSRQTTSSTESFAGGTPGFLAPEQLCEAFGVVSPRTDVFGVGSVLYFLLTGQPPFVGRDVAEVLAKTLSSDSSSTLPATIDRVPAMLKELVLRCLSKEPADRPESPSEVSSVLRKVEQCL